MGRTTAKGYGGDAQYETSPIHNRVEVRSQMLEACGQSLYQLGHAVPFFTVGRQSNRNYTR